MLLVVVVVVVVDVDVVGQLAVDSVASVEQIEPEKDQAKFELNIKRIINKPK